MFKFNSILLPKSLQLTQKHSFAQITVTLIKELRNLTGSSIDECKKALEAQGGDIEKAKDHLKKRGLAQAEKRAHKAASEGIIGIRLTPDYKTAILTEVNCETDFVARSETFKKFVHSLLAQLSTRQDASKHKFAKDESGVDVEIDNVLKVNLKDKISFENHEVSNLFDMKQLTISKLQENIKVKKIISFNVENPAKGVLGYYVHNTLATDVGTSGCVVDVEADSGNEALLKEIAHNLSMQILGTKPLYIRREDVPKNVLDREIENVKGALGEAVKNKPPRVVDQMVEGKLKKYLEDSVLYYQNYMLENESEKTVGDYVDELEGSLKSPLKINKFLIMSVGGEN